MVVADGLVVVVADGLVVVVVAEGLVVVVDGTVGPAPKAAANALGDCATPLQSLATEVAGPFGHGRSRFADHEPIRPRPLAAANVRTCTASSTRNRSDAMSFWPIIGVTPSFAHSAEPLMVVPVAWYEAATWAAVDCRA